MKRFILGFILAISIPVMAAVLWPSGSYLETFQNGFIFGTGKVLSVLNDVITFDGNRLDDRNKDIFYQEDFEGASVSFTCGTDLTAADETAAPIKGTSKSFTQGATPPAVGIKCESAAITLSPKEQDKNIVEVCFNSEWNGNNNEMALNIYGNTSAANLVQVPITASGTPKKHCGYFATSGEASIDYHIEVLTQNANKILLIDSIQFKVDPLAATDLYASSEWEDCGMTASDFSGSFGSVTSIDDLCKREGTDLIIRVKFQPGTINGLAAQITPRFRGNTITVDGIVGTRIPSGRVLRDSAAVANDGAVLLTGSLTYLEFGPANSIGAGPHSARPADEICITGGTCSFEARIPVEGWSDTSQGVVVKNRSDSASVENVFTFDMDSSGNVTNDELNVINGNCSNPSLGNYTCTYNSGLFTIAPAAIFSTPSGGEYYVTQSLGSVSITCQNPNGAVNIACGGSWTIVKKGTDYIKETEKVYTVPVAQLGDQEFIHSSSVTTFGSTKTLNARLESPDSQTGEGICFNTTQSSVNGTQFTMVKECQISIVGDGNFNSTNQGLKIFKDDVEIQNTTGNSSTNSFESISTTLVGRSGDIFSIGRSGPNPLTLDNVKVVARPIPQGVFLGTFGQPTCFTYREVSAGTGGGSATVSSWTALSTMNVTNGSCSFINITGQTFTLESGSYDFDCSQQFYITSLSKIRLRNTTQARTDVVGIATYADTTSAGETAVALLKGKISSNGTDVFQFEYYVTSGGDPLNLGNSNSDGEANRFFQCKITKVR